MKQTQSRERSHRRKRHTIKLNQCPNFSLLREKCRQKFGILYSLNGNSHFCEFSQPKCPFSIRLCLHIYKEKISNTA